MNPLFADDPIASLAVAIALVVGAATVVLVLFGVLN